MSRWQKNTRIHLVVLCIFVLGSRSILTYLRLFALPLERLPGCCVQDCLWKTLLDWVHRVDGGRLGSAGSFIYWLFILLRKVWGCGISRCLRRAALREMSLLIINGLLNFQHIFKVKKSFSRWICIVLEPAWPWVTLALPLEIFSVRMVIVIFCHNFKSCEELPLHHPGVTTPEICIRFWGVAGLPF